MPSQANCHNDGFHSCFKNIFVVINNFTNIQELSSYHLNISLVLYAFNSNRQFPTPHERHNMIHTAELICKLNNRTFSSLAKALPEPKMIKDGNNTVIYQNFPNYGIKITLKCYDSDKCNRPFYFVYLILNLAKLIGQNDSSISLYQICKFNEISDKFREAMSSITSGDIDLQELCDIKSYTTRRIDFCCQFKVVDPQLYIHLLNRGRFPSRGKYCNMGYENSCYIAGGKVEDGKIIRHGSITINIYDKQAEMKAPKNHGKGYTAEDLSEAENVLRVEIQAFRRKMIYLKDKYKYPDRCLKHYLNISLAKELLLDYIKEIAGTADYYTHRTLKRKVTEAGFNDEPKKIKILNDLNGNAKNRPTLREYIGSQSGNERRNLKGILKTMEDKGINPIAIPNKIGGNITSVSHLRSVYSLIEDYFANKGSTVPTDDRLDEEYLLEEAMTDDEIEEDFNQQK